MKRLHVHVAVEDLRASIEFYSALFASRPTVEKGDYAKWMLNDPRVNFAISARGLVPGVDHLGIQVEDEGELLEMQSRLRDAELPISTQMNTPCCYVRSDKHWVTDPQGIAWETYLTLSAIPVFGAGGQSPKRAAAANLACCVPSGHNVPTAPRESDSS
ncbi:ArsI/CadI family heavy metal resistance metalloenzyme [Burkholderia oklahomensis]|uniref:ArsI/CadI family heavy metal resistance metalloenzyme n=1 Tax=Burkholderia oklahomensis TaxID=342113 RepID=UPI00016A803B|nr:ArsI/CadI family heavy metal resistance metalloenzyme [Burkholderia oklahomensis]AJX30485.1 glyoxalase-like domain protein [Burkholderia oklahomensis C6786]AOI47143.1 glyoxalase [Burkholderia oklahomensis C6786]KUY47564.1 glyoxalase [Burkholderia oklahomensis C6786]SUW59558.1 Cadmium-induced protein CadI [Burkholderia oklahomensis]